MELNPDYMTPAERLAAHLTGRSFPLSPNVTRQVSMRLPAVIVARLDTVAAHTGLNRTEVAALLIAAGFQSALDLVPAELRQEIEVESQLAGVQLTLQVE